MDYYRYDMYSGKRHPDKETQSKKFESTMQFIEEYLDCVAKIYDLRSILRNNFTVEVRDFFLYYSTLTYMFVPALKAQ